MNLEKEMAKFLTRELGKDRESPLHKMVIRHAAPGSKGREVESPDMPDRLGPDDLNFLVGEIIGRAQTDADGLGGLQRYALALYEKGNSRSVASFPFRIKGNDDEWDEGAGEEAPNMRGMVQQLMRHNESLTRLAVQSAGSIANLMARRMESLDRQNEKLIEQRHEMLNTLEGAMSQQHDRDLQLLLTEGSEKRKDQVFEKLAMMAPVVLNKLAGVKIFNADDPVLMMVKGLVKSLNGEQFKTLQGMLNQEQQITLVGILQTFNAEESKKQLPEGSSNGKS